MRACAYARTHAWGGVRAHVRACVSTHPQGCGVRMHASGAGVQGCGDVWRSGAGVQCKKPVEPRMLAAKSVRVLGGRVHVGNREKKHKYPVRGECEYLVRGRNKWRKKNPGFFAFFRLVEMTQMIIPQVF